MAEKKQKSKKTKRYFYAKGRRKSSVAMVRLFKGKGENQINGKKVEEIYNSAQDKRVLNLPFNITETIGQYHFIVRVKGGGRSGQKGAIKLALARALEKVDSSFRGPLKKAGLLTRDSRIKERKKPGLKKARKKEQYSKR
jgi:small subunit ribosomal protein S9